MVWVFGNSSERIQIKDLNDVIYYRQKKQYTDQEFEKSLDLKRALQLGKILKLEQRPDIRNSLPDTLASESNHPATPILDLQEMKRMISEVISENKPEGVDLKDLATNLIPIIAETVRQEVSKMSNQTVYVQGQQAPRQPDKFQDLNYVPEINTTGLKSNIEIIGKEVEGSGVSNSLEALKNLNRST